MKNDDTAAGSAGVPPAFIGNAGKMPALLQAIACQQEPDVRLGGRRNLARLRCGAWLGVWLVLASPLVALDPAQDPANYIAGHWDTEDGLPHNTVKQIFQTRDGYIWVGTQQGLARFDGLTFTLFTTHNTPALPGNQITAFAETRDGALWIGTAFGLARYRDGHFTAYRRADGLRSDNVSCLGVAPDGSLWVGSARGLARGVDGKFVQDIDTSAYDTLTLTAMMVDRHNAIWLSGGAYALRYADGKFTRFNRAGDLPLQLLRMIREDAAGRIVAVTQDGLFHLDGDHFVPFAENSALSSRRASTALADRAGNLWVGSIGGLDRWSGGKSTPYVDRSGRKPGVVDALLEDREGCLWLGTSTGLYRLTDRRGYSLSSADGVAGTLVTAVQQTRDGALWIGSWGGGVDRLHNGTVRHHTRGAPLSHETVTAIGEAPDGAMWFGTRGSSLDRLEGGKVTTFVLQSGVASSRPVTAIHADPNGEIVFGIASRGLLELKGGEIVSVPEAAALARATVWSIARLRDGRLWIGTGQGLYERGADRSWQLVTLPGMPPTLVVRALLEEADGTIWLATEGRGLVRWAGGEARSYDTAVGMVDDTLFSVVADELDSLWVSSARGLARLRKKEFAEIDLGTIARLNGLTFGRVDGLLNASSSGNGSPSALRLADGRILTATDNGAAVVEPRLLRVNNQPPTVIIEAVAADDRVLSPGQTVTVPAGVDRLEIRYTAISLIAPQRVRFRYRLEGYDQRWIEAAHERSALYRHLPPGGYTFRALACNSDGEWSDTGATLAIAMLPRFHQTLWFRFAAGALAAVVLASLVGWRLRQAARRHEALARANAELERHVRERTAQLSHSNLELQQRESLFRLIFEHAPVGISWHRADLDANAHYNAAFRRMLDLPADALPDDFVLSGLVHPDDAPRLAEGDALIRSGRADSYTLEQRFVRKDGRAVWGWLAAAVVRDSQGAVVQQIAILEDITARKQAEADLVTAHRELVEASRQAGMSEVATGVLHNVGNVLNSVNVSATLVADHVRRSQSASVAKLAALFTEHQADLATFLTADPRGRMIPGYLTTLSESLAREQETLIAEIGHLRKNIEHIKDIVAMQQNYAKTSGFIEKVPLAELVEDALRMNTSSLVRHDVELVRDFQVRPVISTDKHKVMQILVNLVSNAKYACEATDRPDKRITVRLTSNAMRVRISVSDNGVGIPAANLARVFNHGFTTKKDGHGFGLHSGANAAKELGGSLTVESEGAGLGATFILELPLPADASVQGKSRG